MPTMTASPRAGTRVPGTRRLLRLTTRLAASFAACLAACLALAAVAPATLRAQQEPPRRLELAPDAVEPRQDETVTDRRVRNAFVRDQSILGLAVYGPAFATMVGRNGVTATAGYLVMAGGTFFAAAEVARRWELTEAQQLLSTRMAWRGAGTALYVSTSGFGPNNASTDGAAALLGGLGGTAAGLAIGKGLTPGEAIATVFGHDLAFLSAVGLTYALDPDRSDGTGMSDQTRAIVHTGAGWGGYALGRLYAGRAPYNVTAGDVTSLWLGAGLGVLATGSLIAESGPDDRTVALTSVGGALLGTVLADRALVRRYDHSRSEANLLALGTTAGALMGIGVGVLIAGDVERGEGLTLALAAAGGVAGIALTERYLQPRRDEGRRVGLGRLTIDPVGLAGAAVRAPGRHGILRITF